MIYVYRGLLYVVVAYSALSFFALQRQSSPGHAVAEPICFTIAIAALGIIEAISAIAARQAVAEEPKELSRPASRSRS
jgi:hypothetical protein